MVKFRRAARMLFWAVHSVRYLTLACLCWGAVVLVARGLWDVESKFLLWGWLALPLAVLLGALRSRRDVIDDRALHALFDDRQGAGGLVMAMGEITAAGNRMVEELSGEQPSGEQPSAELRSMEQSLRQGWSPRLQPSSMPRPRWQRYDRDVSFLILSVLFLLGAFFLPTDWNQAAAQQQRLDVSRQVAELQSQLDTLEEEGWLEPEDGEALEEALETLQTETEDPAEAFETLDHLEEQALWAAAQAAEAGLADGERLAMVEAVVDAVMGSAELSAGVDADPQAAAALEEVADLLGQMADDAPWMSPELAAELQASGASAAAIQAALDRGRAELKDQLERLREAGVLDGAALQQLEAGQQPSQASLEAFLEQNQMPASEGVCQTAGSIPGQRPGQGGLQRGPGHAPLTVRDAALFDPEWTAQVLPGSGGGSAERSQLLGERRVAPQEGGAAPGMAPPSQDGLRALEADGAGAWTHTVLPRHRQAVRSYFDRSKADSTPAAVTPADRADPTDEEIP